MKPRLEGAPAGRGGTGGAGGYRLVVEPMALNGHFHTHFTPRLAARVREVRPQILHMDEEPYNLATAQAFWIARRAGRALLLHLAEPRPALPPAVRVDGALLLRRRAGAFAGNGEAVEVLRQKGYQGPGGWCPPSGGGRRGAVLPPSSKGRPLGREARAPLHRGLRGRLRPQKGAHLLVQAVGALGGDTRLELLGWGPEEGRLRAPGGRGRAGPRFAIHQALPSERVPEFLSRLDALVLPSLTFPNWKEQFGRALTEAMACEVPVVGSDLGRSPASSGTPDWSSGGGRGGAERAACACGMTRGCARELARGGWRGCGRGLPREQIARQTLEVYREVLGQ